MAIYQPSPGRYVISSRHTWLPGVYSSERAARYAFRLPDSDLARIWDAHCAEYRDGTVPPITFEKMHAMARHGSASPSP